MVAGVCERAFTCVCDQKCVGACACVYYKVIVCNKCISVIENKF